MKTLLTMQRVGSTLTYLYMAAHNRKFYNAEKYQLGEMLGPGWPDRMNKFRNLDRYKTHQWRQFYDRFCNKDFDFSINGRVKFLNDMERENKKFSIKVMVDHIDKNNIWPWFQDYTKDKSVIVLRRKDLFRTILSTCVQYEIGWNYTHDRGDSELYSVLKSHPITLSKFEGSTHNIIKFDLLLQQYIENNNCTELLYEDLSHDFLQKYFDLDDSDVKKVLEFKSYSYIDYEKYITNIEEVKDYFNKIFSETHSNINSDAALSMISRSKKEKEDPDFSKVCYTNSVTPEENSSNTHAHITHNMNLDVINAAVDYYWTNSDPRFWHPVTVYNSGNVISNLDRLQESKKIEWKVGAYKKGKYIYELNKYGHWVRYRTDELSNKHDYKWSTDIYPYSDNVISKEIKKFMDVLEIETWRARLLYMDKNCNMLMHKDSPEITRCSMNFNLVGNAPITFDTEMISYEAALLNVSQCWHAVKTDDEEERLTLKIIIKEHTFEEMYDILKTNGFIQAA